MRPLGSSEFSILRPSAGSGFSFRAGAFVSLRVEEQLAPGSYRVASDGRAFVVHTDLPLECGAEIRARVQRDVAGSVLRIVAPGASKARVREGGRTAGESRASIGDARAGERRGVPAVSRHPWGMDDDAVLRPVLTALHAEGFTPDTAALSRLKRLVRRVPSGRKAECAALAAALEAKGIAADEALVAALVELPSAADADATGDGQSGGGNARPHDGGRGRQASDRGEEFAGSGGAEAGSAQCEREEGFVREVPMSELPTVLGAFLRALSFRAADNGAAVIGGAPSAPSAVSAALTGLSRSALYLGLFNHARGAVGASVLVPFSFSLDSIDLRGRLRILLPYAPGGRFRLDANFVARNTANGVATRPSSWSFSLRAGGGADAELLFHPDPEREAASRLFPVFARGLATSGCHARLVSSDAEAEIGEGGLDIDA